MTDHLIKRGLPSLELYVGYSLILCTAMKLFLVWLNYFIFFTLLSRPLEDTRSLQKTRVKCSIVIDVRANFSSLVGTVQFYYTGSLLAFERTVDYSEFLKYNTISGSIIIFTKFEDTTTRSSVRPMDYFAPSPVTLTFDLFTSK